MKATIALALLILSSIDISMAEETEIRSITEGARFELECVTNLQYPVVWYFQHAHQTHEILLGGEVPMTFQTMFRLTGNQLLGEYNLHIPSADGRYVGNYRCIDNEGQGSELQSIQINITASTSAATMDENEPAAANHEALNVAASIYQKDEHSSPFTNPAAVFGIVLSVVILAAIAITIIIIVAKPRCVKAHAPESGDVKGKGKQRPRIPSSTSNSSTAPLYRPSA